MGRALDYYAVLGVARNASVEQIERAYRALARKVHPDRNAGDAERADARMKQLNPIRETLTDPLLRAAYDDRLRQEHHPAPAAPPRPQAAPQPPPPRAEDRWRQTAPPPRYEPHPHVAPFLRTNVEEVLAAPRRRREFVPTMAGVLVAGLAVTGVAVFWPRPDPPMARRPDPPLVEVRPQKGAVTIVRGDTTATRRAVRKTAKVVPVGFTMDEVIAKFGPPDTVESHPAPGDVTLIYGKVRVEMKGGKVVGGEP